MRSAVRRCWFSFCCFCRWNVLTTPAVSLLLPSQPPAVSLGGRRCCPLFFLLLRPRPPPPIHPPALRRMGTWTSASMTVAPSPPPASPFPAVSAGRPSCVWTRSAAAAADAAADAPAAAVGTARLAASVLQGGSTTAMMTAMMLTAAAENAPHGRTVYSSRGIRRRRSTSTRLFATRTSSSTHGGDEGNDASADEDGTGMDGRSDVVARADPPPRRSKRRGAAPGGGGPGDGTTSDGGESVAVATPPPPFFVVSPQKRPRRTATPVTKRQQQQQQQSPQPQPQKKETTADGVAVPVTPDAVPPLVGGTTAPPARRRKKGAAARVLSLSGPTPEDDGSSSGGNDNNNNNSDNNGRAFVPPPDWEDTYRLVQELRSDRTAPCDKQGAEALPEPGLKERDPKAYRFQVLVALMLSSQTKDATVGRAMRNLQRHGLTVDNLRLHTSPETLDGMIREVGFHNTKTKHLGRVVQILHDDYGGDIPPTAADMIRDLPGVGPKMAYLVENICYPDRPPSGIGVDTHMQRLFPRLGFVPKDVKNPEQTRKHLEAWLPSALWVDVNLLWVGFGQEVQQERAKVLAKAWRCSRPREALLLLEKAGLDVRRDGPKLLGWDGREIEDVLASPSPPPTPTPTPSSLSSSSLPLQDGWNPTDLN